MAQGDEDSMRRKHLRRIAPPLVLAIAAAALAGCGGGGDAASPSNTARIDVADATTTLSSYCMNQFDDGTGDIVAAMDASERIIKVAREHPDLTNADLTGLTMRQVLVTQAHELRDCDPQLAQDMRDAVEELP